MEKTNFECLKKYNKYVKLYNNQNIPYNVRKRFRQKIIQFSKECAREGVWIA